MLQINCNSLFYCSHDCFKHISNLVELSLLLPRPTKNPPRSVPCFLGPSWQKCSLDAYICMAYSPISFGLYLKTSFSEKAFLTSTSKATPKTWLVTTFNPAQLFFIAFIISWFICICSSSLFLHWACKFH